MLGEGIDCTRHYDPQDVAKSVPFFPNMPEAQWLADAEIERALYVVPSTYSFPDHQALDAYLWKVTASEDVQIGSLDAQNFQRVLRYSNLVTEPAPDVEYGGHIHISLQGIWSGAFFEETRKTFYNEMLKNKIKENQRYE